ncbi:hypothetical protein QTP86_033702, partial [Hemibagrus guttatus]
MYERSRTVVRCAVGQTEEFNVEVGLHQGSALSPFLFAIVMDQLSEEVRQESPWTMMFADDIVICSESREQVEENLERWRFALERRGMKVSRSKTEYMCVNEREGSGTVRLQGEEVKKVQEFKYLGSTVQSNGECGNEVKKRVQAGWNGWRKVSGVLCDQKISARIKGKVYRTVVRPAMLYGLETVSLRKRQESELEVAELKMLRVATVDRLVHMFQFWHRFFAGCPSFQFLSGLGTGTESLVAGLAPCPGIKTWVAAMGVWDPVAGPPGGTTVNNKNNSFIVYRLSELFSGHGEPVPSQASLGIKAGYTLDGVPTHCRVHTHTTDNLEMPINLPCMSLEQGRKPEYPEENPPEARGEHANSTHMAEAGLEPPPL